MALIKRAALVKSRKTLGVRGFFDKLKCSSEAFRFLYRGCFCMRRCITEKLVRSGYCSWLDLGRHTVWGRPHNAFSRLAPVVQIVRHQPSRSPASCGARWGREEIKTRRFFHMTGPCCTFRADSTTGPATGRTASAHMIWQYAAPMI